MKTEYNGCDRRNADTERSVNEKMFKHEMTPRRRELLRQLRELLQARLDEKIRERMKYDWNLNARDNQLQPGRSWSTWLILAGRGFGKTRTGAETIRQCVKDGYRRIGIIGHTIQDVEQVMLHGESGLMNITPEKERPVYIKSKNLLRWPCGAAGMCISSCAAEQIRGHQFDCVWIDELAKFAYPEEVYNQVNLALRLTSSIGEEPKMLITTTPRSVGLLKELIEDERVVKTYGSTYDNSANLSAKFLESVKARFEGSKFGKQELYGELIDLEGGLCSRSSLRYSKDYFDMLKLNARDNCDIAAIDDNVDCITAADCSHVVIAVDPSVGGEDETGIVVVGVLKNVDGRGLDKDIDVKCKGADVDENTDVVLDKDGARYAVLEDASGRYKVSQWPEVVVKLYKKYRARCVVAEVNQGGDMIESLLRQIDAGIVYQKVYASKNKVTRAQPVVAMYERGNVYHAVPFPVLEKQLCETTGGKIGGARSPDRLDALVWGLTYLAENYSRTRMDLLFFSC